MVWIIYSLLALVLIWLGVGAYVFFTACRRQKELDWLDKTAVEKTLYGKYADSILQANDWLNNHAHKDVYTESYDGLKLHATWVPAENPKGSIILAHGYRSCKLLDFGVAFEMYHGLGLNILAIDQRSHGLSQGKYITFGVKESRDLESWIKYHADHLGGGEVILSGLSMGAATVMYTADRTLPGNVKGRIADCGFSSPAAIIAKVFCDTVHFKPGPFMWSTELFARVFAGFSMYSRDARKTLTKNSLPIVLVHGLADDFVPSDMTREASKACVGNQRLLLVEEAGHGTSYLVATDAYKAMILEFLEENLEDFHELRNYQKL